MGVVYLATDVRLDRRVAIKVLPPDHAKRPGAKVRFLREARTVARLSHPNIVPIHAVEESDGAVYYAMAYVEGETVEQRVVRAGPLAPLEAARLLRDVAWALAYAHARGVIHRDIKPDNILFDAETGRAMVTDFGIAWVDGARGNTGPHLVFGTPEFMSPEQAQGHKVDGRSDTYSLGVVGFYALSGRVPFDDVNPEVVMARQVDEPPPPLGRVVSGAPVPLTRAVDRCLAKDPDARFQRAEDLANAMTRVLQEHAAPPLAVRAFVTDSKLLSAPAHLYALFLGGVVVPLEWIGLTSPAGPMTKLGLAAAGVAALGVPAGYMLWRVRRLLATGHDREDLVDVLRLEHMRLTEEVAFAYGGRASRLERWLRVVAYVSLAACGVSVGLLHYQVDGVFDSAAPVAAATAAAVSLLAAIVARLRTEHRMDPVAGRRHAFWSGRLGQWLFRMAAPRPAPAAAPLHPTATPSGND
jgi:serine/threonine-protein kinase